MNNYDIVMGVEIHCELKTKTKCFSSAANTFGEKPNSQTSAVDCGFPGTLPAINQAIVISAIKACSALNMDIDPLLRFDRKNYFYPDLPKGYQITQFYHPIGRNGYLKILVDNEPFTVNFERLHIEEDTAKQIHYQGKTLLDYNRAGIGLIEIVTKPIFTNSNQVVAYVNALRQLLVYLEISDAKMNEGSLRCDINISLKIAGSKIFGTKVEIKNLNSTNNISLAIKDEIIRQSQILNNNEKILLQTRRFDEKSGKTVLMRTKESNNDYKYFPEPNISPIQLEENWIKNIIKNLPEIPAKIAERLLKKYKLNKNDINILMDKIEILRMFEETVNLNNLNIATAKLLLGPVQAYCNSNNTSIENTKLNPYNLAQLVTLINDKKINDKQSKELLAIIMTDDTKSPINLVKSFAMSLISDEQTLTDMLLPLLKTHETTVMLYKDKPERLIKFFMGQLMKNTKGSANPQIAQQILKKLLDNYKN